MKWRTNLIAFSLVLAACSLDQMAKDSKIRPLAPSPVFSDLRSSRPPIPGTVARGQLKENDWLWRGEEKGKLASHFPFRMTIKDLEQGRLRFEIHCSPCHGRTGEGNGIVAQRGFSRPPSYFLERLKKEKPGDFFQVITFGFGAMPSYAAEVDVEDRWRIVAYIKALQSSRFLPLRELTPTQRAFFEGGRLHEN